MKKYSKDTYGLLYATMWMKKIISILFPQQLNDRGLIGVAKIETAKTPF